MLDTDCQTETGSRQTSQMPTDANSNMLAGFLVNFLRCKVGLNGAAPVSAQGYLHYCIDYG